MSELTVRKLFDLVIATCFVSLLFLNLPLLVGGHDHHHHHDHVHEHESPPHFKYSREANEGLPQHEHKPKRPFGSADWQTLWIQAIGSTLLVSIAPFILLFFVPLDGTAQRRPLLKVLLSFASGGLLGDAFLHLIPHALAPHDHHQGDDDHDHGVHDHHHHHHGDEGHHGHSHGKEMMVGLWVLAGILIFLFVEKFVRLLSGGGHAHSHSAPVDPAEDKKDDKDKKKKKDAQNDQKPATSEKIQIAGYLNLAADITHNFTDGLAIGASFLAGKSVGFVTTLTILLHEVPHEIGDFAILIQSGCSRKKAIYLQLLTALGALSGTVLSLLADGYDATATSWILPLTAGGFIYIATVSVLPELLADTKLSQSLKEIGALLVGVYMMVLIAQYE